MERATQHDLHRQFRHGPGTDDLFRIEEALAAASRILASSAEVDIRRLLGVIGDRIGLQCLYLQRIPADFSVWDAGREASAGDVTVWWRDSEDSLIPVDFSSSSPGGVAPDGRPGTFEQWLQESGDQVLAIPILSDERTLYGYLGFVREEWPLISRREVVRLLGLFGDLFANFFERRATEQTLQQTEDRWRTLVSDHPDPILVTIGGRIHHANAAAADVLGASTPEHLTTFDLLDFVSADEYDAIVYHLAGREDESPLRLRRHQVVRLDGQWRTVESVASRISYRGHEGVQVVLRDLTDHLKSEERYRTFVRTISEGIWRLDLTVPVQVDDPVDGQVRRVIEHGVIGECNKQLAGMLGVSRPERLLGRPIPAFLHSTRLVEHFVRSRYVLRNYELSVRERNGADRHFVLNVVGGVARGKLQDVWGSCIEVTEQVDLERRMVSSLEKQQQDIGRDLHDGLGQLLTGIRMLTDLMVEKAAGHSDLRSLAERVAEYSNQAQKQVRTMYRGLTPAQLGEEGLANLLADLASGVNELPGVRCSFEQEGTVDIWDGETKLHLYRIAQEACNNALKHAKAGSISISMSADGDETLVQVRDDGTGFDPHRKKFRSLGINSMRYRARCIRGRLEIETAIGHGTRVLCIVPGK